MQMLRLSLERKSIRIPDPLLPRRDRFRMEKVVLRALVFTAACCSATKHVFVAERAPWSDAQKYCRAQYTDLSPLTNALEEEVFTDLMGRYKSGWVGLYWDSSDEPWSWSGGVTGLVRDFSAGLYWVGGRWFWRKARISSSFFCLDLVVVPEQKTWEEALYHCLGSGKNLTSLLSESESLLARTQIQDSGVSGPVWTGMRYLEDRWMWVNGDPVQYEAWTGGQEDPCPLQRRCGALTPEGTWEDRDCGEKLSFVCA
ncbi:macrophage mannose receptor 1-like [Cololabis saira]|uniref:macrophage mannose receptor 1-like n=1 Tax=Cololabis saira TaxID=129043 RepID=UPI002AD404C1|nr:macrophage mannose receptor 1-like [Cololabis saira]